MHKDAGRDILRLFMSAVAVFMAELLLLPVAANGAQVAAPALPFQPLFEFKKYHIHYDVNPDGTYRERGDEAMTVLSEQGVRMAQFMPIGMEIMKKSKSGREVKVVTAYTLKKNGEHVTATPAAPVLGMGQIPPRTPTLGDNAPNQMKIIAFRQVQVGDTLVFSYVAVQKKPLVPNNVILDQIFPRDQSYDDAIISLSAPASMHLRTETRGVDRGQHTREGNFEKWEWKYQNKQAAAPKPNQGSPLDQIHISSFKDQKAEIAAMMKLMVPRCPVYPGNPNDGPRAIQAYMDEVTYSFWKSDYLLRKDANDWNTPTCVLDDGRPRLAALSAGLLDVFSDEKDWSKSRARVEDLRKKYPGEPFAALSEVEYWKAYAWNARGGGYASSVSGEGWKLFRERMEKAEKVLLETKSYSSRMPIWYQYMIGVQSALGRPEDERDKVFLEGVKRFPTYYPIYFTMLGYLEPKWGGTWRTVDNMIKWSVDHTRKKEGDSMYARLYWIESDPQVNLFKDTFASWPKMKQGFEDLMARHPKSKWNLNNFARFACLAGDRRTFLKLRKQIGKNVIDDAWPENTSLDLCETKFGYAE